MEEKKSNTWGFWKNSVLSRPATEHNFFFDFLGFMEYFCIVFGNTTFQKIVFITVGSKRSLFWNSLMYAAKITAYILKKGFWLFN